MAINPTELYERMRKEHERHLKRGKRVTFVSTDKQSGFVDAMVYSPPLELIRWSEIMNGDLSPKEIVRKLVKAGYQLIKEGIESPVGEVPKGSTVLTDYNEKRAVWIDGKLYQKP